MIIAGNNVVSEFMRDTPDPVLFLLWVQSIEVSDLGICETAAIDPFA